MAGESKGDSRLSPRVENDGIAPYYVDSDMPHVLARVRLIDSFLADLIDREDVPEKARDEMDQLLTKALNDSLAVYALDLARTLIVLEDLFSEDEITKKWRREREVEPNALSRSEQAYHRAVSQERDNFLALAKKLVRVPKEAVTAQTKATRPQPQTKPVKRPKT